MTIPLPQPPEGCGDCHMTLYLLSLFFKQECHCVSHSTLKKNIISVGCFYMGLSGSEKSGYIFSKCVYFDSFG